MKSIANQYRDLKEGKMSQANFMRNLRMAFPQYITNVTSLNDSIKILKNKGILNEVLDELGPAAQQMAGNPEEEAEYKSALIKKKKSEDEDEEFAALLKKIEDEESGKYTKFDDYPGGISEAKTKLNPNQVHPQELRMGIKVELEHTDDIKKAEKIALDHLAENPFYYTALKLAGVESPSAPKPKEPKEAKKAKVKEETTLVDKDNQMKTPKGVEKVKASANKAHKETNKGAKGVQELTHTAKKAKGIKQVMSPTGGKMKSIKESYYQTNVRLTADEEAQVKKVLPDAEFEWDEDDRKQVVYSNKSEKEIQNIVNQVLGLGSVKIEKPKTDLGTSFDKFKKQLEEIIREVLDENK